MDKQSLIEYLSEFISKERWELFQKVIQYRTKYITVALEDIYQPHNASAVLRSCDCFGVQDVHIIENRNIYTINPGVSLGASKWLSMKRYNLLENNSLIAVDALRKAGYRIVATTPHTDDIELQDFDLDKGKVALFFGTEMQGLSRELLHNADEYLRIPMYGFTESFNISVSAAIVLHNLTSRLRNSSIHWQLPNSEKQDIMIEWIRATVKRCDLIEKDFYKRNIIKDKTDKS